MTDIREDARNLLAEFYLCLHAKPRSNAVNIQLEKDSCSEWANYLIRQINWGEDNDVAEACHQLESRLSHLKKKVIIEVLTNGTV